VTSHARTLQAFSRELTYSTYCPRLCRFACPVAEGEHRETVTPTMKMTLLHLISRGKLPLDRETGAAAFRCTGCGLHTTACEHGIDIAPALRLARELAAEAGATPEPLRAAAAAVDEVEAELQGLAAQATPQALRTGRSALIPGPYALRHDLRLIQHTWAVLGRITPEPPALWPGPQELGSTLLAAGDRSALQRQAVRVARAAAGFSRLWVLDPEEAWLLRKVYPELGVELLPEVRLPLEALDRHLPEAWRGRGAPAATGDGPLVFHDPCHLGRHLGLYDAPRRILRGLTGEAPREPPWSREQGWCCGGGQGYATLTPEGARRIAGQRATQLLSTGARRVVTACPRCRDLLGAALQDQEVPVLDLLELVDPTWS